jgi:hypothetical protein
MRLPSRTKILERKRICSSDSLARESSGAVDGFNATCARRSTRSSRSRQFARGPPIRWHPSFNEKLLADPANGWYKTSFQDAWDAFSKNSRIKLITIPNARVLILDDQPKLADEAIAAFVEHVSKPSAGGS